MPEKNMVVDTTILCKGRLLSSLAKYPIMHSVKILDFVHGEYYMIWIVGHDGHEI